MYWDNINVSSSRIGRGGTTASGALGDIPQEIINQKYETTDIYEDINEVDQYHRGMLKYEGPDTPNFEEEDIRRDNQSEARLNVHHHGSRSEYKPYHPRNFTGLTENDPVEQHWILICANYMINLASVVAMLNTTMMVMIQFQNLEEMNKWKFVIAEMDSTGVKIE